jgi:low temperature requirement protein LtrA
LNPNYQIDMLTGLLTLILMAVALTGLIPDLGLRMAQNLYGHQMAMRSFYRWQARAFAEYWRVYRRTKQEARES